MHTENTHAASFLGPNESLKGHIFLYLTRRVIFDENVS